VAQGVIIEQKTYTDSYVSFVANNPIVMHAEVMKLMTLERIADVDIAATTVAALRSGTLCITSDNSVVSVPNDIAKLVVSILNTWAGGSTVTLVAHSDMLTTQQVADLMHVSRPFVTRLVDRGDLACVRVGKHRRVSAASVIEYLEQTRQAGAAAIADEARQNVADNLY
jgi:excisionase family DNA binding protein